MGWHEANNLLYLRLDSLRDVLDQGKPSVFAPAQALIEKELLQ